MQDSLEDRIHAAGKYDQFEKAVKRFRKTRDDGEFYDSLCDLGASPEEADEFVNLMMGD